MKKKKEKQDFFVYYFNDFFDKVTDYIGGIGVFLIIFLPIVILTITIYNFHNILLFWFMLAGATLILAEIIYLQFAKTFKGNLIGWKILGILGALQIIGMWLLIPFWIIKSLTKLPFNKIWLPCLIFIIIAGVIVLYFWLNIIIGRKVRRTNK